MRIPRLSNIDFTLLVIPMIIYVVSLEGGASFVFGEMKPTLNSKNSIFTTIRVTTFLPMCKFYKLIIKKGNFLVATNFDFTYRHILLSFLVNLPPQFKDGKDSHKK